MFLLPILWGISIVGGDGRWEVGGGGGGGWGGGGGVQQFWITSPGPDVTPQVAFSRDW